MSILLSVVGSPGVSDPRVWLEAACFAAVALVVLRLAGAFRRGSVVGRSRITTSTAAGFLWLAGFTAFGVSVLAPSIYLVAGSSTNRSGTTAPSTARAEPSPHQTAVLFTLSAAAGLATLLVVHSVQGRATLNTLGLSLQDLKPGALRGAVGAAAAIPMMFALSLAMQEIWRISGFAPPEEHALLKVLGESSVTIDRLLVVISAVVLAPLWEELLFRAHLQTALGVLFTSTHVEQPGVTSRARWIAILITATLFALAHGVWWMMPPLFLLAVFLGYAYERTGNLWTSIVMHGTFNAVSIALEYLSTGHR